MPRRLIQLCLIGLMGTLVAGCSATENVRVRNYMQDKQRVDQEVEGKLGNWQNSPDAVYTATKDTRKIYVVEVTQDKGGTIVQKQSLMDDQDYGSRTVVNTSDQQIKRTRRTIEQEPVISLPSFDDDYEDYDDFDSQMDVNVRDSYADDDYADDSSGTVASNDKNVRYVDYKVTKNDTLQKISKKFYDGYSKWPRIYEANKSIIKNPDRIKPGITIRIPMDN